MVIYLNMSFYSGVNDVVMQCRSDVSASSDQYESRLNHLLKIVLSVIFLLLYLRFI